MLSTESLPFHLDALPGRHVPFFRYGINRLALDEAARLVTVKALGACFEHWPAIMFHCYYMSSQIEMSLRNLTFMGPCIVRIFQYISNKMQPYTVYYICKLLYMFRVVPPPIIRSANNYLQHLVFVTRYGQDGPVIESRWGLDILHPSSSALGPTQVPGLARG